MTEARRRAAARQPAEVPRHAGQKPGLGVRKAAARLLAAVIEAKTSLDGLTDAAGGHPQYRALDERDRALCRAILDAALRHRVRIERTLAGLLDRPLPGKATALGHLLHVAAAQILFLDVPASAAVDLAVDHAKSDPRVQRFAGLVNAVLRQVEAKRGEMAADVDAPGWFRDMLVADYGGERAAAIIAAHVNRPPLDLTVKSDPAGWAERLGGVVLPTGTVRVAELLGPVPDQPGFGGGEWWVQDAAAALPARLFGDLTGKRALDLCAAPGGKTAQLALAGSAVTALDASANRLRRLASNLERLKLAAVFEEADLFAYAPSRLFDAVLLDAPCSSTGTVRRHPDIPWTKSPEDIAKLSALQRRMLDRAAGFVRPGGLLVFSNCSLARAEGEDLLPGFLRDHPEMAIDPVRPGEIAGADAFIDPNGALRTTPDGLGSADWKLPGCDGFYAVRLRRTG